MKIKKQKIKLIGIFVALVLALVILPGVASAHERRIVGTYQFTVGFLNEPAFVGDKNSLDLTICNGECKTNLVNGASVLANPVKGADQTLKAEVSVGGSAPMELKLEPRFNADGKYNAWFYPTKTGDYTFHIYGTINTDKIDEKFTSKPGGFGSVEDTASLQYPVKLGNGADTAALQQQVKDANDRAGTATIFAIIGGVLGLAGLTLGGVALTRKRPPIQTATTATPEVQPVGRGGPEAG